MKKLYLTLSLGLLALLSANAQTPWNEVSEFGYSETDNPVSPGGNNMLQGAAFTSAVMNDSWATLDQSHQATYDGNSFSTGNIYYTAREGRGTARWTAQMYLQTNYKMENGKKYDLSFKVRSTAANNFTVKVESAQSGDINLCEYYVTLPANQEVVFALKDAIPTKDINEVKLIFDAGGAEINSSITISDIVMQSAQKLTGSGTPQTLTAPPAGYVLVWNDEFDDPASINKDNVNRKWEGMDWKAGNVNNELQTYKKPGEYFQVKGQSYGQTPVEVKDGKMIIHCFEGADGKIYSGRLDSHASNGGHSGYAAWRYGYMEARIKLPSGKGTWPAYWMMPEGVNWTDETWPTCGEIDIMEEVGNDPNVCVSSLHAIGHYHANNTQVSGRKKINNMEGGWITYALLWDNDNMAMYADGQRILTYANDHDGYVNWPYDRPYYITLNLAYGGDWGGGGGIDKSKLPLDMEIDYVRVYQIPDPDINTENNNTVYLQGNWNAIGIDQYVPSSTFTSWNDNYIPMKGENNIFTKEIKIGKQLHKDRVGFLIRPAATTDNVFTPNGAQYKVTMEENPYFTMNNDGWVTAKSTLSDGVIFTLILDCSQGANNAVLRVAVGPTETPEPVEKPAGIWIIGADQSIVPGKIDGGSNNWEPANAIQMIEKNDVYTYEFELGKTLSRTNVNFKFFCQAGWGKEFLSNGSEYRVTSSSPFLGIGTGTNNHDNGNIYKLQDFPENAEKLIITLDCTYGYNNAILTTDFKFAMKPAEKPADGIYIIGADKSIVPGMIDGDSWNWQEDKSVKMEENEDHIYSHEFELGTTLSRNTINFKFFPQNGFNDETGTETAFLGMGDRYVLRSESEYIGVGKGQNVNNVDNGNIYKLKDFPSDKRYMTVTLDCTNSYNDAVLRTSFTDTTGITSVQAEETDANWYDLAGRIIRKPTLPGIYLHGRRKVVIR